MSKHQFDQFTKGQTTTRPTIHVFPTFHPQQKKKKKNENKKHPTNPKYHKHLLSHLCNCEHLFHLLFSRVITGVNAVTSGISNRRQHQRRTPSKSITMGRSQTAAVKEKGTRKTHQHGNWERRAATRPSSTQQIRLGHFNKRESKSNAKIVGDGTFLREPRGYVGVETAVFTCIMGNTVPDNKNPPLQ